MTYEILEYSTFTWLAHYLAISTLCLSLAFVINKLPITCMSEHSKNWLLKYSMLLSIILPFILQPNTTPITDFQYELETTSDNAVTHFQQANDELKPNNTHGVLYKMNRLFVQVVLSLWLLIVSISLINYLRQWSAFRRKYSGRRQFELKSLAAIKKKLNVSRDIYITTLNEVTSPMAIGTSEICIPRDLTVNSNTRIVEAMLAHEIWHLKRNDPIWKILGQVISIVFFFQPLNRLIQNQLELSNEFLCDKAAADFSKDELPILEGMVKAAESTMNEYAYLSNNIISNRNQLSVRSHQLLKKENTMVKYSILTVLLSSLIIYSFFTSFPAFSFEPEDSKSMVDELMVEMNLSEDLSAEELAIQRSKLEAFFEGFDPQRMANAEEVEEQPEYFDFEMQIDSLFPTSSFMNIDMLSKVEAVGISDLEDTKIYSVRQLNNKVYVKGNTASLNELSSLIKRYRTFSTIDLKRLDRANLC